MVKEHTYTDAIYYTKVALLGPYPPPFGGVSVHIQRSMHKLHMQHNMISHFDTNKRPRFLMHYALQLLLFILKTRPRIIIHHTVFLENGLMELWLIIILKFFLRFSVFLADHDPRYLYTKNKRYIACFNMALCAVDTHIIIGDSTYRSYQDNGVNISQKAKVESAFLPPDINQEAAILKHYPKELFLFFETHTPIICANAFQLHLINGKDLYGCDLCIELIAQLKDAMPQIGFIFALVQVGDMQYYQTLHERLKNYGCEHNFYFFLNSSELWPLIKRSDLFVRPTLSDSFGISVAEACYFNIPTVASDACQRPSKAQLFQRGNQQDFFEKTHKLLLAKQTF